MNILRGIVATILIIVFALAAAATGVALSAKHTVVPQTADMIIEQAKVGERVTAILPDVIIQGVSGPVKTLLKIEDVQKFVAEALPAEQVVALIKPAADESVSYIRGEGDTVSKIDLAPTEVRAVAAAKKIIPGKAGGQFAAMLQAQFKSAGLDKGLEIPRQQLDAAKNAFTQFALGTKAALALTILLFLLIAAIAPHGLRGRLHWCAAAAAIAGCITAAVATVMVFASGFIPSSAFGGNTPPQIKSMAIDAIGTLSGILSRNIFIAAAIYIVSGAALVIISLVLPKGAAGERPVQEFSTLPKR